MLTLEQKKLVEENHNLIYTILYKMKLNYSEYYGDAAIALCKAAIDFKPDKGKFSTIAYSYIKNSLINRISYNNSIFRDSKNDISLNFKDSEYKEIINNDINIKTNIEENFIVEEKINGIKKTLTQKERDIFELLLLGYNNKQISKIIGFSEGRVSQWKKEIKKKYLIYEEKNN